MATNLIVESVLKDSSKAIIKDTTVYTSPARSSYYSNFYAYKVDTLDQEVVAVVTTQGDPTTAITWEVTTPQDGHYRFKLLLYWIWESVTTFAIGEVVYRSGTYYIALTSNSNTAPETSIGVDWDIHTPTVADSTVANVILDELNCILSGRLKACFSKEVAAAAAIACGCDIDKKPMAIQRYERLALLINGIAVDDYQGRYAEGEKKVLYMTKIC